MYIVIELPLIFKPMKNIFTLNLLLLIIIFGNSFQSFYSQGKPNPGNSNTNEKSPSLSDNSKLVSTDIDKKDTNKKDDKSTSPPTSERVIVETNIELVEDDACECAFIATSSIEFPFFALFAIGGGVFVPVAINQFDDEPPPGPNNVVSPSSP